MPTETDVLYTQMEHRGGGAVPAPAHWGLYVKSSTEVLTKLLLPNSSTSGCVSFFFILGVLRRFIVAGGKERVTFWV